MFSFDHYLRVCFNNTKNLSFFLRRMSTVDISSIRAHYGDPKDVFDVKDLVSKDPLKQFDAWFKYVHENKLSKEPNAVNLATSSKDGIPSNRMVLLKDYSDKGFKFFTNYSSRKGHDLAENPYASLCFYWEALSRQVRVEGRVERISDAESEEYFSKRPFNSRISAYISAQSEIIRDKQVLFDLYEEAVKKYSKDNIVPKPVNWGGFLLIPKEYEFWQGNDIRLHDRLRFRKPDDGENLHDGVVQGENNWIIERLAP